MRWTRSIAIVLLAVALMGVLFVAITAADANAATRHVWYVVDGDTIRLKNGTYVRQIGDDTPERGECGYKRATRHLDSLIGKAVTLRNPKSVDNQDYYGRLLRYIDVGRLDTGLNQIRHGLAKARYDTRGSGSTGGPTRTTRTSAHDRHRGAGRPAHRSPAGPGTRRAAAHLLV
jgi:endonuclease YncB( thermonuclease family)